MKQRIHAFANWQPSGRRSVSQRSKGKSRTLKPHLTRSFTLSRDPQFKPKFCDVIGLSPNPPPLEV
jgi:hypothetical protein